MAAAFSQPPESGVLLVQNPPDLRVPREMADMVGLMRTLGHELHNLSTDPGQQERIAALHAALAKELGEDPERTEQRFRAGASPEHPLYEGK